MPAAPTETSALTHTMHDLWSSSDRRLMDEAPSDMEMLQRCVHESLRLHPASPVAWRRALAAFTTRSGTVVDEGVLVVLDLEAANRDPLVWGTGAAGYDPMRQVPDGVHPWGLSFGAGSHACIGMELDGGVVGGGTDGEQLYGTVALLAAALLHAGATPDAGRTAQIDRSSERLHFATYPVVFSPGELPGAPG